MKDCLRIKPEGKWVVALLIVTNTVYAIMLTYTIPTLMEYSAGLPIFDLSPMGYSYGQAVKLLSALGNIGREFYLIQLALDLVYPFLFGLSYYLLFQWILSKNYIRSSVWQLMSVLPILAALFDYSENIGIWLMLSSFPNLSEVLVKTVSMLTMAKSMLVMSYWLCLFVLMAVVLVRIFKNRNA